MTTTPASNGAKDQVGRLLTLVPYLHARGAVRVDEAAADLGVSPTQLVSDLKVLFMCGLPGGYPDDLIDVDLDALEGEEGDGVIRVSNADYLARPLRLSPTEATAMIVALRALRNGAADDTREVVDRTLAKLGGRGGRCASTRSSTPARTRWPTPEPGTAPMLEGAVARPASGAADLLRPRRATRSPSGWSTREAWSPPTASPTSTPSATAPRRRGCSGSTGSGRRGAGRRRSRPPPRRRATSPTGSSSRSPDTILATVRLAPPARWVVEYYPVEEVRELRRRRPDGRPPGGRRALAAPAAAAARLRTPGWSTRTEFAEAFTASRTGGAQVVRRDRGVRWNESTDSAREERHGEPVHRRSQAGRELMLIVLVILLLFGAKKLPELARGSGRALRIFKAETKGLMDDDDDDDEDLKTPEQREIEARRVQPPRRQ